MGNYKLKYSGKEIDELLSTVEIGPETKVYVVYDTESKPSPEDGSGGDYITCLQPKVRAIMIKMYDDYINNQQTVAIIHTTFGPAYCGVFYPEISSGSFYLRQVNPSLSSSSEQEGKSYSVVSYNGKYFRISILSNGKLNTSAGPECANMSYNHKVSICHLSPFANYAVPYEPRYPGSPATKQYVDNSIANIDFANVLTQNGTTEYQPTEANDVTTKQYVDEAINNAITDQLNGTY